MFTTRKKFCTTVPILLFILTVVIFLGKMFIRDFAEELKLHDIEIDEEELGKEQIDLWTIVSKNALKYALKGKSDVLGKCRIPLNGKSRSPN